MRDQASAQGEPFAGSDAAASRSGNLVMQLMLIETYGPRLNIEQLAAVLGMTKGAIYNQISAESFPIATYVDGGRRWADCRDVAEHFEQCRLRARGAKQAARALVARLRLRPLRGG